MKVSKQTYQDMKAGVKLAGRITKQNIGGLLNGDVQLKLLRQLLRWLQHVLLC